MLTRILLLNYNSVFVLWPQTTMLTILAKISVVVLLFEHSLSSPTLPCHLKWKETGTGENVPEKLVPIQGANFYAARGIGVDDDL